jgi:hypothetical protein
LRAMACVPEINLFHRVTFGSRLESRNRAAANISAKV